MKIYVPLMYKQNVLNNANTKYSWAYQYVCGRASLGQKYHWILFHNSHMRISLFHCDILHVVSAYVLY